MPDRKHDPAVPALVLHILGRVDQVGDAAAADRDEADETPDAKRSLASAIFFPQSPSMVWRPSQVCVCVCVCCVSRARKLGPGTEAERGGEKKEKRERQRSAFGDSLCHVPRTRSRHRQRSRMAARAIHGCGRAVQRLQWCGSLVDLLLRSGVVLALLELRALVLEGLGLGGLAELVVVVFVFFIAGGHVGDRRLGGLDAVGVLVGDGWCLTGLMLALRNGVAVGLLMGWGRGTHWVVRVMVCGAGVLGGWVHAVIEKKAKSVRRSLRWLVFLAGRGNMGLTRLHSWEQTERHCCRSRCAVVVGRHQDKVRREGLGLGEYESPARSFGADTTTINVPAPGLWSIVNGKGKVKGLRVAKG